MKRTTVILMSGKDAYIVSCNENVDITSGEGIVEGLRFGQVRAIGTGVVANGKLSHVVDMDSKPMVSPNRASRINIIDVETRRSLGKMIDVAPEVMKKAQADSSDWHVEKHLIHCSNCGGEIRGTRRVKGKATQKFIPDSKSVINQGKGWYCTCTNKPAIPPAPEKKEVFVGQAGGTMTITLTGTYAQCKAMSIELFGK